MRNILQKIRDIIGLAMCGTLAVTVLAALFLDGYVQDTKTDEGRYLLLLRLGREPAEWVETNALRYWFETIHNIAFLATACWALAWAVVYLLWREWRESQGQSKELD